MYKKRHQQKDCPWTLEIYCPGHLGTYIFSLGAEHLILDCKLISIPPGVLWEGQQKHLDQPEGRKKDVNKIFMFSTAQKNKHVSITV